jgi:hypothetical protein
VTIKKLVKGNPTMAGKFAELKGAGLAAASVEGVLDAS